MPVTVTLWRPDEVGFDLDTIRPYFEDKKSRDDYFDSKDPWEGFGPIAWINPGDPIVLAKYPRVIEEYTIGRINVDYVPGGEKPEYHAKYYFTVQKLEAVGDGRTRMYYAIDWELTHMIDYKDAYILRCPVGLDYALSTERKVDSYQISTLSTLFNESCLVVILKQMKLSSGGSYISGPFYIMLKCDIGYPGHPKDPISEALATNLFVEGDIEGVYVSPLVNSLDSEYGTWVKFPPTESIKQGLYSAERSYSYFRSYYSKLKQPIKTDLNEGVISGFCDSRGNILFTVPYGVTIENYMAYMLISGSGCSCYVALYPKDENLGYVESQLRSLSFNISCPSVDVMTNTWREYAYRQREVDIESRRLANIKGLISTTLNPVNMATSFMAGGPAGLASNVGSNLMSFGLNTYFGNKEQGLTDLRYKLSSNVAQIIGAGTAEDMQHPISLYAFTLLADPFDLSGIIAENMATGVPAQGFTGNMKETLKNDLITRENYRPWAFTPLLSMVRLPAAEKDAIRATCSKGCRWYKT